MRIPILGALFLVSCSSSGSISSCPSGQMLCGSDCVVLQNDLNTTCALIDGGTTCTNLANDPANCGFCGQKCSVGDECEGGQCLAVCVAPEIRCSDQCVNPETDDYNCGGCAGDGGAICPAGETCDGTGRCLATCASPLAFCAGLPPTLPDAGTLLDAGDPDAGYCADLGSDPLNCGVCGSPCGSGNLCVGGQCQLSCPAAGQSCASPFILDDAGVSSGDSCCGSALALSDGGCLVDPSTLMIAYQLPQASLFGTYTFQLTDGFVGSYTPGVCLSQLDLTTLICTNGVASSFPAVGGAAYLAIGQLDGGCGPFTLSVVVSSGI